MEQNKLTNSATSFALPFSESLWILDLSFSGAAEAILTCVVLRCLLFNWLLALSSKNLFTLDDYQTPRAAVVRGVCHLEGPGANSEVYPFHCKDSGWGKWSYRYAPQPRHVL